MKTEEWKVNLTVEQILTMTPQTTDEFKDFLIRVGTLAYLYNMPMDIIESKLRSLNLWNDEEF